MRQERIGIVATNWPSRWSRAGTDARLLRKPSAASECQRRKKPKRETSVHAAGHSHFPAGTAAGARLMNLFAQAMKYFMFERSSWPPSCCRHASSPSSKSVFTGGIFAV